MGSSSIDWSTELLNSTVWIIGVFLAAVVGTALIGWLLLRSTVWGRQVRRLAGDYFRPDREPRSWGPMLLALSLLFMTVAGVRMSVLFSYWANDMLTSLQMADAAGFWTTMFLFLPLAGIWIVYQLLNVYATGVLTIKWRIHTNNLMLDDWLRGEAYQRGHYVKGRVDNPDQRIQEDVYSFVSNSIGLVIGVAFVS